MYLGKYYIINIGFISKTLKFSMEHPSNQEIQVWSNEVPGITNGHTQLRGH